MPAHSPQRTHSRIQSSYLKSPHSRLLKYLLAGVPGSEDICLEGLTSVTLVCRACTSDVCDAYSPLNKDQMNVTTSLLPATCVKGYTPCIKAQTHNKHDDWMACKAMADDVQHFCNIVICMAHLAIILPGLRSRIPLPVDPIDARHPLLWLRCSWQSI